MKLKKINNILRFFGLILIIKKYNPKIQECTEIYIFKLKKYINRLKIESINALYENEYFRKNK
jgi:hypothetical protein